MKRNPKSFSMYCQKCNQIMKLYREAASETGYFEKINKRFDKGIGPIGHAYQIKFSLKDKTDNIKYYFNDTVNWIVFTIDFAINEEELCQQCYGELVQHFKNRNVTVEKVCNGILDIYSEKDKEQQYYVDLLEHLEHKEINENTIKNNFKEMIATNHKKYIKESYEIISKISKNYIMS